MAAIISKSKKIIVSEKAIVRAVASSTAIETGQSVKSLELKIQQASFAGKFKHLKLAD